MYLVFSEYQYISWSAVTAGECSTVQDPALTLPSQLSVTSPPGVDESVPQYNATMSLIDLLKFSSCTPVSVMPTALSYVNNATPAQTSPSANPTLSSSASTLLSSAIQTFDETATSTIATNPIVETASSARAIRNKLNPKIKTAITVVSSGLFVALIILGILAWRRYRERKIVAAVTAGNNQNPLSSFEEIQPYLQRKSELEAKEAARHEVHAEELRYELPEDTVHEMDDGGNDHEILTEAGPATYSLTTIHELKGEEHSKELEAH